MADNQDILNVPIYINGGKENPSTKLEERELYLNLTTSHLYAGGIGSADYTPIRAGYADCLDNTTLYINAPKGSTMPTFRMGTMMYNFLQDKFTSTGVGAYSVENANLLNINKLVLSSNCYGETLPSSGAQGQLFFKIG